VAEVPPVQLPPLPWQAVSFANAPLVMSAHLPPLHWVSL
jgi:hypothetical protein